MTRTASGTVSLHRVTEFSRRVHLWSRGADVPATGPEAGVPVVQVIGTGFTGATEIEFGTNDLDPAIKTGGHSLSSLVFTLVSSTLITLTDPSGTGVVDVRVVTPVGTSALSAADRFSYTAAQATVTTTTPPVAPPTTTTTPPVALPTTTTTIAVASGGSDASCRLVDWPLPGSCPAS